MNEFGWFVYEKFRYIVTILSFFIDCVTCWSLFMIFASIVSLSLNTLYVLRLGDSGHPATGTSGDILRAGALNLTATAIYFDEFK